MNRIEVRISWALVGVGLLVGAFLLLLRERKATDNPPATNGTIAVQRSSPERLSLLDSSAEPVPVTPAAVTNTNPPAVNAADLYRQAFHLLDGLSEEEQKLLRDWHRAPELSAKLYPKLQLAIALAHQATTNCDWGVTAVNYVGAANESKRASSKKGYDLGQALMLSAAQCRAGDAAGAGEDLLAVLRLSQNLRANYDPSTWSADPLHLMEYYLPDLACSLSAATLRELAEGLTYASDEMFYQRFEIAAAMKFDPALLNTPELMAELPSIPAWANLSEEQILAKIQERETMMREALQVLGKSDAAYQYQEWRTKWATVGQANPVVEKSLAEVENRLIKGLQDSVNSAMLTAGLRVLADGPEALQQCLDPSTGQPFQYQATATGFSLTSTFTPNDWMGPLSIKFRK